MAGGFLHLRLRKLLTAALCACLLGCYAGCTPENRYKVLSFFFDGVPDPNAPPTEGTSLGGRTGAPGQGRTRTRLLAHKPFANQECAACHSQAGAEIFASALDSKLCAKCHEKVPDEFPIMHGPVAVQACLWCHHPHESEQPHLLRTAGTSLCLQCHERDLLTGATAGHKPGGGECLTCHVAHGSHPRNLIRPGQDLLLIRDMPPAETQPAEPAP